MIVEQAAVQKVEPNFRAADGDFGAVSPTPRAEIDAATAELRANKDLWAALDLNERIAILDQILINLYAIGQEWVEATVVAKGVRGNAFAEAEEWAMLAYVLRLVRLLRQALRDIQSSGRPSIPGRIDILPGGQVRAQVFPVDRYDSLVFSGMTAEVWMQPGVSIDQVLQGQAQFYRGEKKEGKVTLVLGAGNSTAAVPFDFLSKLFVEGCVVIVKMNPANSYLGPLIARGFRRLIDDGFLRIVYGGAEEGSYLCRHPDVDELHMTGMDKTFEAILFGTGPAGQERKAQRTPLLNKRFTCELGNVSPVIVVPGPWTAAEIDDWGEKLARWLVINAGFNCVTPRVIIQSADWALRQDLNSAITKNLAQVQTRKAYYPGAQQRHEEFVAAHPGCRQTGMVAADRLPWTFITDVDPSNTQDICFQKEAFCALYAETALEASDIPAFLAAAVNFANEHLWGNLSATLVVHPAVLKDAQVAAAVERAVADLRYGMVLLNQYAGLGLFALTLPWGAYAGNDIYNIQSGQGFTCNTLMFDKPQKVVVRNPFKIAVDPLTLQTRTGLDICRRLADLQFQPSIWKIPGFLWSAIRS